MNKKHLAIFAVTAFVFTIAVGGSSLFLLNYLTNRAGTQLTAQQKREIFQKMLANNSSSVLANNKAAPVAADAAGSYSNERTTLSTLPYYNQENQNTYRYSKTIESFGSGLDQCEIYYYPKPDGNRSTENYQYIDSDNRSYYKSKSFDAENNLTGYYLTLNNGTTSENYEYLGGSYAVKSIYSMNYAALSSVTENTVRSESTEPADSLIAPAPTNSPIDGTSTTNDTSSESPLIEPDPGSYFGADADILGTQEINGETYYIVQYSHKQNCKVNPTDYKLRADNEGDTKIITRNLVHSKTYEIINSEVYVNEVNSSNLIVKTTTSSESRKAEFKEVSGNFKFEYNVPVKEIKYPEYKSYTVEESIGLSLDYLRDNNNNLLLMSDETLSYGSASFEYEYAPKNAQDHLLDRTFYPAGKRGNNMLSEAQKVYANIDYPKTSSVFSFLNNGATITMYEKGVTLDEVIKFSTQGYNDLSGNKKEEKDVNVVIDGKSYIAKHVSVSYATPVIGSTETIEPAKPNDSLKSEPVDWATILVFFEYKGIIYQISSSNSVKDVDKDYILKSYDLKNPNVYDSLKAEMVSRMNTSVIDSGAGSSSPGSDVVCTMDAKQCPDGSYVSRDAQNKCEFSLCP